MTAIAAIRTHRWGDEEARLFAQLHPVFGDRLVVVFHNRQAGVVPPLPVVDMNDASVTASGLRAVPDYGWRCGDYALHALRAAHPGHDHYWLVEPDVAFTGPVEDFFGRLEGVSADALGVRFGPVDRQHRFGRTMPDGMALTRAIFALVRFSGRALDRLLPLRQAYAASGVLPRHFANDEIFSFSHVAAAPDLTVAAMADLAPDWFADSRVETDPDMLIDTLAGHNGPGVFHPVRSRAGFIGAVIARAGGHRHFFAALRPSLAHLSDAEIAAIADGIGREARAHLRAQRDAAQSRASASPPVQAEAAE